MDFESYLSKWHGSLSTVGWVKYVPFMGKSSGLGVSVSKQVWINKNWLSSSRWKYFRFLFCFLLLLFFFKLFNPFFVSCSYSVSIVLYLAWQYKNCSFWCMLGNMTGTCHMWFSFTPFLFRGKKLCTLGALSWSGSLYIKRISKWLPPEKLEVLSFAEKVWIDSYSSFWRFRLACRYSRPGHKR